MAREPKPVPRIALVGPECSGKTTLAQALADRLGTYWVPEYWRFYWDAKRFAGEQPIWTTAEFVHVAEEQSRLEDHYATRAKGALICDTNAFLTAIWHRRYLGFFAPELDGLAAARRYAAVLYCEPDMPFVQDGVRDGESIRLAMGQWIRERLVQGGHPFTVLQGPLAERLDQTLRLVSSLR